MKPYLRLLRPLNCGMSALAVLIGAYLGGVISLQPVFLAMAGAFLICGGGMAINDYYDRDIDLIHKSHRPIPSGKVSLKGVLVFTFVLFAIGLYIAFWINIYAFALAVFNVFLLVVYAMELQKKVVLSNAVVSFLVASTFVFGGLTVGNWAPAAMLGLIAFFANMVREILKDVEDRREDALKGIKSIPMVFGEGKARGISSVLVIVSVLLSPLPIIYGVFGLLYGVAVIPCVALFLYTIYLNEKEGDVSRVQKMIKFAMLLGLVAFLIGAF